MPGPVKRAVTSTPVAINGAPTADFWIAARCLQAGISLATIAAWYRTSIQMISQTHGRTIRRHEGTPPLGLAEQYQIAKVQAMSAALSPASDPPTGAGWAHRWAQSPKTAVGEEAEKGRLAGDMPT